VIALICKHEKNGSEKAHERHYLEYQQNESTSEYQPKQQHFQNGPQTTSETKTSDSNGRIGRMRDCDNFGLHGVISKEQ
jgi:hypothetical protein